MPAATAARCQCGCPHAAHEHLHGSTYCSGCMSCDRYNPGLRAMGRRLARSTAVHSAAVIVKAVDAHRHRKTTPAATATASPSSSPPAAQGLSAVVDAHHEVWNDDEWGESGLTDPPAIDDLADFDHLVDDDTSAGADVIAFPKSAFDLTEHATKSGRMYWRDNDGVVIHANFGAVRR